MEDDGVSVMLTPVQLAAILSGQNISEGETLSNRLWGGMKLMAGSLEMVGAAAFLLLPEPTMASKMVGSRWELMEATPYRRACGRFGPGKPSEQ